MKVSRSSFDKVKKILVNFGTFVISENFQFTVLHIYEHYIFLFIFIKRLDFQSHRNNLDFEDYLGSDLRTLVHL